MTETRIRKITTSGIYSKVVVLPRTFIAKLKWRENQNVKIELDEKNKRLIIRDSKEK